jgi:hypothetical protein
MAGEWHGRGMGTACYVRNGLNCFHSGHPGHFCVLTGFVIPLRPLLLAGLVWKCAAFNNNGLSCELKLYKF